MIVLRALRLYQSGSPQEGLFSPRPAHFPPQGVPLSAGAPTGTYISRRCRRSTGLRTRPNGLPAPQTVPGTHSGSRARGRPRQPVPPAVPAGTGRAGIRQAPPGARPARPVPHIATSSRCLSSRTRRPGGASSSTPRATDAVIHRACRPGPACLPSGRPPPGRGPRELPVSQRTASAAAPPSSPAPWEYPPGPAKERRVNRRYTPGTRTARGIPQLQQQAYFVHASTISRARKKKP